MKLEIYKDNVRGQLGTAEYEPGIDPDLRPCPFCGNKDVTVQNFDGDAYYYVYCKECGARGPECNKLEMVVDIQGKKLAKKMHEIGFAQAIEKWNATPEKYRR